MSALMLRRRAMGKAGPLVSDTFTRADSTTTLGSAETGQLWVPRGAGSWGISAGKAYRSTTEGDVAAWVDAGVSDATCQVAVTYDNPGDGFVFRGLGASATDGFLCYLSATEIVLLNPGFTTQLAAAAAAHAAGTTYVLKAVLSGASITIFRDGAQVIAVTNPSQQTATQYGLRRGAAAATSPRFDDFTVAV